MPPINPAKQVQQTQDARIPDLDLLPAGTDRATLSIPAYDPATDATYQTELVAAAAVTYTDAQARAAQLNRAAPAGTTTVTLTAEAPDDYGTALSGTFTIDPTACVVGKVVRFALGAGTSAPVFGAAPGSQPYKYYGVGYTNGRALSYSLLVCVDRIEVVILAD